MSSACQDARDYGVEVGSYKIFLVNFLESLFIVGAVIFVLVSLHANYAKTLRGDIQFAILPCFCVVIKPQLLVYFILLVIKVFVPTGLSADVLAYLVHFGSMWTTLSLVVFSMMPDTTSRSMLKTGLVTLVVTVAVQGSDAAIFFAARSHHGPSTLYYQASAVIYAVLVAAYLFLCCVICVSGPVRFGKLGRLAPRPTILRLVLYMLFFYTSTLVSKALLARGETAGICVAMGATLGYSMLFAVVLFNVVRLESRYLRSICTNCWVCADEDEDGNGDGGDGDGGAGDGADGGDAEIGRKGSINGLSQYAVGAAVGSTVGKGRARSGQKGVAAGGERQPLLLEHATRLASIAGMLQRCSVEVIDYEDVVVKRRIGLGAFAEVFAASWHGSKVAVKKCLFIGADGRIDADSASLKAFAKEVQILCRLQHPNVTQVYGVCLALDHPCIVMELAAGGSVFDAVHKRQVEFSVPQVRDITRQTACALKYLHSRNVIHRDLKTQNLLLAAKPRGLGSYGRGAAAGGGGGGGGGGKNLVVKVCDFGLSRAVMSHSAKTMSSLGTPQYMCAEVLRSQPYNFTADMWSLGVIVIELLTGTIPFASLGPGQIIAKALSGDLRHDVPGCDDLVLRRVVEKCLSTEPEGRPSAEEVVRVLSVDESSE